MRAQLHTKSCAAAAAQIMRDVHTAAAMARLDPMESRQYIAWWLGTKPYTAEPA